MNGEHKKYFSDTLVDVKDLANEAVPREYFKRPSKDRENHCHLWHYCERMWKTSPMRPWVFQETVKRSGKSSASLTLLWAHVKDLANEAVGISRDRQKIGKILGIFDIILGACLSLITSLRSSSGKSQLKNSAMSMKTLLRPQEATMSANATQCHQSYADLKLRKTAKYMVVLENIIAWKKPLEQAAWKVSHNL